MIFLYSFYVLCVWGGGRKRWGVLCHFASDESMLTQGSELQVSEFSESVAIHIVSIESPKYYYLILMKFYLR